MVLQICLQFRMVVNVFPVVHQRRIPAQLLRDLRMAVQEAIEIRQLLPGDIVLAWKECRRRRRHRLRTQRWNDPEQTCERKTYRVLLYKHVSLFHKFKKPPRRRREFLETKGNHLAKLCQIA